MTLLLLTADDRLTPTMRAAVASPRTPMMVSAASAWEMAIKAALGRLAIPEDLAEEIERQGFDPLPVSVEDGLAAGAAPTPCRPPSTACSSPRPSADASCWSQRIGVSPTTTC